MNDKITLKIQGMHCGGCVSTIESAILKVEGVKSVKTDLGNKMVFIEGNAPLEKVLGSISATGYEAEESRDEEGRGSFLKKLFKG